MAELVTDSEENGGICFRVFGQTDVGQVREHNEDNFLVADLADGSSGFDPAEDIALSSRGAVFGVCDGMGGAAAGEVASQLAVDGIRQALLSDEAPGGGEELAARLVSSVQQAGLMIFEDARADRSRRGMGTTSTVATLVDNRLFLAQVGDSRAYIVRGEELVQVTRDQSLVNQLIEAGQLTEEEAETFEHNNIILQALGTSDAVQVDLTYVDLRADDILLLCSDGLSGMIRSEDIRGVVLELEEPELICSRLIECANEAGGHDNITVVVVKFSGPDLAPYDPEEEALAYRKFTFSDENGSEAEPVASRDTTRLPPVSTRRAMSTDATGQVSDSPEENPPSSGVDSSVRNGAVPMQGMSLSAVGSLVAIGLLVVLLTGFFLLRN